MWPFAHRLFTFAPATRRLTVESRRLSAPSFGRPEDAGALAAAPTPRITVISSGPTRAALLVSLKSKTSPGDQKPGRDRSLSGGRTPDSLRRLWRHRGRS